MNRALHTTDNYETRSTIDHIRELGYTFGIVVDRGFITIHTPGTNNEELRHVGQRLFIEMSQREDELVSDRMKELLGNRNVRWINHLCFKTPTGEVRSIKDEVVRRYRHVRWAS